jgi:hypothetical protein
VAEVVAKFIFPGHRFVSNFYATAFISSGTPTTQIHKTGTENLSVRHGCNREIASLFAQATINLVGSKRTDRITLVGREHIELLIQLAHCGFVDVMCRDALAGPNTGEMSADLIIAPGADRGPQLAALLSRLEHGLNPDGVLLLGAGEGLSTRLRQIRKLLIERGFHYVDSYMKPTDIHLLCCRKFPVLQTQAA